MFVYLSVMLLCCILMYAMRNNKNKILPLVFSFGGIWLMISLQEGWGGDYGSYVMYFDHLKGLSLGELIVDEAHGEVGYKILMSFMPTVHIGLVVCMAIWCYAIAFFFYHFIPQKWWWFAILFVFFDKSILMGMIASFPRMAIACSFLIFAVYSIFKDKRLLAAGLIILGSFFHLSVIFMIPLVLVGKKPIKLSMPSMVGLFAILTVFFMIFPSSWFDIVDTVVNSTDVLESYSVYLDESQSFGVKGLVLIVLFYWVYLLSKTANKQGLEGKEYLVMYYALIRIAFDLLPAVGFASRFYYYIDLFFLAGLMCVMNQIPKNDSVNKIALAATLLLIFWFTGFREYSRSPFFLEHWASYNFIF